MGGRRDPSYVIVLHLILAHIGSVPKNTQEASHTPKRHDLRQETISLSPGKVSDRSTLHATSTGQIEARENSTATAFSTKHINAVDSTLSILYAVNVTVSGNCVVQIQNCSRISARENAMIRVTKASQLNVQAHDDSVITLGKQLRWTVPLC